MFDYQRKPFLLFLPILILCCFFGTGCITVKNYPTGKPFIYQTTIHVQGALSGDEKKALELQLAEQIHDSVRVRAVSKAIGWDNALFGFVPRFFYEVRKNPTAFDSLHAGQSIGFMRTLLNSLGYYRDSSFYRVKIDTSSGGQQLRTQLDFYVNPETVTRLDSIGYALNADTATVSLQQHKSFDTIQKVTMDALPGALIKKGDAFSKYKLSAERDRLANVYRNNGYMRFSEEELLVLWDTVGIELLRPTIDPIEEVRLLQERTKRRLNPVADVEFRLRDNPDSTRITRYHVGRVTLYPDYVSDTTASFRYTDTIGKYLLQYNQPLFKKKIFPDYIFLNPGDLYRQSNVFKTQNKFNSLGTWRVVNIAQNPRPGQDTADFDIRLTPARKYTFNTNFEVSYNRSNITIAQGNLIGVAINSTLQNRNFARGANLGSTNFRFGIELNATLKSFIQTRQISFGHTIQIPRLVPAVLRGLNKAKENTVASVLTLNGGITDRRDYFSLATLNSSWGYQFAWKNKSAGLRFPNIEYNYLVKKDSLDTLISKNASYKYIFNTGFIISALANYNIANTKENSTSLLSLTTEISGPLGLVKSKAFNTNLYQFVKVDLEYRQTYKLFRNAFAWRVFTGIGITTPGPTDGDTINRYLPFFREYFAGGPNSMRAWSVRKLGPGSSIRSFGRTTAPDRFGDIRFEGNAEYRFFITNYGTIGINTALYTDVGNVWFLRKNPDFPDGEFPNSFSKLWKDIAIGLGTGLRIDFGTFLKVRLDYAYKVKDPTPELLIDQNRWFHNWQLFNGQVQLGIDYPF